VQPAPKKHAFVIADDVSELPPAAASHSGCGALARLSPLTRMTAHLTCHQPLPPVRQRPSSARCLFSGFAALVYQVVWMRHLSLFFGSDVYAAAITLSVFNGGLVGGKLPGAVDVARVARPLLAYGLIEIAIGVYAFCFSRLLHAFTPFLESVYRAQFDAAPLHYQLARHRCRGADPRPATALHGRDASAHRAKFCRSDSELGRFGGFFYASNTLGALAGTLMAAFALIPFLGIARTTLVAVGINLAVGALVAGIFGR